MIYKVEEVSSDLCTGTLRAVAIEARINRMAKGGWKFEQMESVIGRCCLIFQRYKVVICFSKETESLNENTTSSQSENFITTQTTENWECSSCYHTNPAGTRFCEKCGK
ncbi:MAG: hypothetical protein MR739_10720 [Spirochaetia bacterium]|nr:hypothetical protein [Spirochaetia bacterium]